MSCREQKLIDILFECVLTATDPTNTLHKQTNEQKANWAAYQLRSCGFDTQPVGASWGVLIEKRQETTVMSTDENITPQDRQQRIIDDLSWLITHHVRLIAREQYCPGTDPDHSDEFIKDRTVWVKTLRGLRQTFENTITGLIKVVTTLEVQIQSMAMGNGGFPPTAEEFAQLATYTASAISELKGAVLTLTTTMGLHLNPDATPNEEKG